MKLTKEELLRRRDILCEKYILIKGLVANLGVPESYREDLIQEIFVAAYINIHKLNDIERLDAWLYRISYRKMILFSKAHRIRFEREISYPDYYGKPGIESEEDSYVWKAMDNCLTDEELCEMINSLKAPAPYIIKLRFEMGFNLKEISDLLNMKYNTVKTIERRAFKKLKVMIEERGYRKHDGQEAQ